MSLRLAIALPVILALACSPAVTTNPDFRQADPNATTSPKRCLQIARIYRSEIVDDDTILFHMRGGAIWQNQLPQRCYGLRMQGGFGYTTPLDRLCDLDLIQVLEGSRSVCGLGRFEAYEPPRDLEANAVDAGDEDGPTR